MYKEYLNIIKQIGEDSQGKGLLKTIDRATEALKFFIYSIGFVIEDQHLCMMMRGVEKQNSNMVTSAMLGSSRKDASTQNEFLKLIGS